MFKWLQGNGLAEVQERFVAMLGDDRHVFDLAMAARVGGADPTALAEELYASEERTDEAERQIRRLVLVHASVRGSADLPSCLMYMSIAKDAERIGDLSKGLFGIAESVGSPPPGPLRDELIALRDEISPMIPEAGRIFSDDDQEAAHDFIERSRQLQRRCRDRIEELLQERTDLPQAAASVLSYRHLSRIVANLLNIVSAVVVPLDQLDYPTAEGVREELDDES
jgi:phosphate uptake regulator